MTKEELQQITVAPQQDSTVKITGEIPYPYLEKKREGALKKLGEHVKIDGFRSGHIPENVLIERVGEMTVLSEMAERALKDVYPRIVEEHALEVIGYPQISITKLAKDNPLGFTITVATMPEVTLPDYQKIAKEKNTHKASDAVTDKEVEEQIQEILKQKAAYERLQKKAQAKTEEKDATVTELPTPETVADKDDAEDLQIPELTDELVKTLGQPGQFENVADFKSKIREHLEIQKKQDTISKHRADITDAIIAETNVALPQVMIDAEINQMFAQMEDDLTRAQLKLDDYLAHIKKTKEDLRKEWIPAAEKRAKLQLVLGEIAQKEDIKADKGDVDSQVSHLLQHHKDADEKRVRIYVESMLTNEAVMKTLEAL